MTIETKSNFLFVRSLPHANPSFVALLGPIRICENTCLANSKDHPCYSNRMTGEDGNEKNFYF